jgi:hypothetical protein
MSNPWLNIPLDDYEGHMSLPAVGQAQMIAEQLDHALIGCAGGNGLERIAGRPIERVVARDAVPRRGGSWFRARRCNQRRIVFWKEVLATELQALTESFSQGYVARPGTLSPALGDYFVGLAVAGADAI